MFVNKFYGDNMDNVWLSWNENKKHPYKNSFEPTTELEICEIVKIAEKVRMIGTGKSSADIIAGTDTIISYEKFNQILSVDKENFTVSVQPGIRLKKLLQELEKNEMAFPALPDIDDITVGGAVATGTHGTGKIAQSLSEYIKRCKIVNAKGEVEIIDKNDDRFNAVKVSIGLLGIFTEITFQCIPRKVMNIIERPMKDTEWLSTYKTMLKENDFLRILWLPHTDNGYVITGNYIAEENRINEKSGPWYYKYRRSLSKYLYGKAIAKPSRIALSNKIIQKLFFSNKQQKFGSLYDATVTKSRGSTLELAEWTVAIDRFDELFVEMKKELDSKSNNAYAHIPMDIRFMKSESGWLANGHGKDIVTVGCVSRNAENADNYEAFELVEEIFLKYDGRPHWAKRFQIGEEILFTLYPKWSEFIELRRKMDPDGKFLNEYLKGIFK